MAQKNQSTLSPPLQSSIDFSSAASLLPNRRRGSKRHPGCSRSYRLWRELDGFLGPIDRLACMTNFKIGSVTSPRPRCCAHWRISGLSRWPWCNRQSPCHTAPRFGSPSCGRQNSTRRRVQLDGLGVIGNRLFVLCELFVRRAPGCSSISRPSDPARGPWSNRRWPCRIAPVLRTSSPA